MSSKSLRDLVAELRDVQEGILASIGDKLRIGPISATTAYNALGAQHKLQGVIKNTAKGAYHKVAGNKPQAAAAFDKAKKGLAPTAKQYGKAIASFAPGGSSALDKVAK